jgi:hypothetical protein
MSSDGTLSKSLSGSRLGFSVYLDEAASTIRGFVPADRLPAENSDDLFRIYAVLLRAKGDAVTQSDIHDAWSLWAASRTPDHPAIVPNVELTEETRLQDEPFVEAVRKAAQKLGIVETTSDSFSEILFPLGAPKSADERLRVSELYRVMVDSSEKLVGRRQAVNTFFLTINGAVLTAAGVIVQRSDGIVLGGAAIAVLAIAGAILCGAWRSLILSFGQLNRGKFKVINSLEQHLAAAVYAAEWEALGRGSDPEIYRSFTSREIWVPNSLLTLHVVTAFGALVLIAINICTQ